MVVRMLEYDFAIALDNIMETNNIYEMLMGGHILELDIDKYIIWFEETWNKGKIEGKIEERVASILELLEDYGTVPESLKQRIYEEKNIDILKNGISWQNVQVP